MGNYYGVVWSYDGNSLSHHGIKGQRWGIRRYQNEDGTLTDEGRRHLGYSTSDKSSINRHDYRVIRKDGKAEERELRKERRAELKGTRGAEREKVKKYYAELESGMAKSRAVLEKNAGHDRAAEHFNKKAEKLEAYSKDKNGSNKDVKNTGPSDNELDKALFYNANGDTQKILVDFAKKAVFKERTAKPNTYDTRTDKPRIDAEREKAQPYRDQLANSQICKELVSDKDISAAYKKYRQLSESGRTRYGQKNWKQVSKAYKDFCEMITNDIEGLTGEYGREKIQYSRPASEGEHDFKDMNEFLSNFFIVEVARQLDKNNH